METMKDSFLKLEMDDCEYWLLPEKERENKCITFLIDAIKSNSSSSSSSKDMVVTCGYLPLPNDQIYRKIETDYGITLKHILILVKDKGDYIKYIKKRGNDDQVNQLLKDYEWRENNKNLYDSILFN